MYRDGEVARRLMRNLCSVDYILRFDNPGGPGRTPLYRTDDFSTVSMVVLRNDEALPRARLVTAWKPVDSLPE